MASPEAETETALKCQEHEDERFLNLVRKAHRLSMSMMKQKAYDNYLDVPKRDVPPAHYTFKIRSFSQLLQILSSSGKENYESHVFEASGYKWKLSLYPNGIKEKDGEEGEGHISLYLVIAETESLPVGWKVKANFTLFVLDQVYGTYSIFQANGGKQCHFHESKREFGFDKLIPLNAFMDPINRFLIRDKCAFGVEVFVWNNSRRGEVLSSKKKGEATHTWRIENFSSLEQESLDSDDFILANRTWAIQVYPKGYSKLKGEYMSLYLKLTDSQMKGKVYANYKLRIRDQLHGKHKESGSKKWFEKLGWGLSEMMKLSDLHNASMGFLVEDTLIIEVDILPISCAEKLISSS